MKCSICGATQNLTIANTRYRSTTKDYYIRYLCPAHKITRKYISQAKHQTNWDRFYEPIDVEWIRQAKQINHALMERRAKWYST